MIAKGLSAAFTTDRVEETKAFYIKHFDGKVTFDCGWYVNIEFGCKTSSLQFMAPQVPEHQLGTGAGLIYNFEVDDVDYEFDRLISAGLTPVVPLEDHPWGDRGFAVLDPNGISLYIYSLREPSDEFKAFIVS